MRKVKISRQFKNFRIYKDLYRKPCKRDRVAKVFLIQILLTFGGRWACNRYFWDIRLKIFRLPNFNMLLQLVLTKFFKSERFSCLPKVDHAIKSCKEPIRSTARRSNGSSARSVWFGSMEICFISSVDAIHYTYIIQSIQCRPKPKRAFSKLYAWVMQESRNYWAREHAISLHISIRL